MQKSKDSISLIKNVVWNGILSISQILFPLITFPYITRTLGVDANGANSFSLSVASYFLLFASIGIPTYGVKACAKVRGDKSELSKVVQELLSINCAVAVGVLIIYIISIYLVPQFQNYKLLLSIYSFEIVLNVIGVNWMYQGIEKYRYITTRAIIFKLISIILMVLFVKKPSDIFKYAIITVFASYGGNIINAVYSRTFVSLTPFTKLHIRKHCKPILFLFATTLAVSVYSHMDSIMLGIMKGDHATGIYYVAVKVKTVLITLISSFSVVLLSRLSNVESNGNSELVGLLKKSYSVIIMTSIPVVLFFILFSKNSVLLLSGSSYLNSSIPMKILMPTVFISAVSQILGNQYSVAVGKEKNLMLAVICGAFINLVANSILIPLYSYNGAALGTLLAEFTQCAVQIILAKAIVKDIFSLMNLLKVFIANICAGLVSYMVLTQYLHLGVFTQLLLAATIYFSIYFIGLYIVKYEMFIDAITIIVKKK